MTSVQPQDRSRWTALAPRTAALFILLYQIRLIAADLADTPFFAAALAGGLLAAIFLYRVKINGRSAGPFQAVVILALVPWVIRFLIALPRWFFPGASGGTVVLDSLLLNLDRNNFSALLPFYWVAVSTYFSQRSRVFLRADIIAADTLFLVLFSIAPTASMDAYRWPILMIALFGLVIFLQIFSLVLSTPPELKLRRGEGIKAGVFLFVIIFLGGAFFLRPFQEKAVEKGGGLLEPKLFRFDFSQILRLESEISVSDDLVLIVKKDSDDYHTLLRRYTLSGYSPKQGFFRIDDVDEAAHPKNLPDKRTLLPGKEIKNYRVTNQEYYLVNFDASAFIGMNMPVEIIPFETWDASSFSSAYAVKSHTSEVLPFELIETVRGRPGPESLGMSPEDYALYTEYGGDEAIAAFAREITRGPSSGGRGKTVTPSYWEEIQMIYDRLKYGEYRYSLKPGIAPNGDQLKYFLFDAKKGYCSYYAFAFTLMLRSLGIPCRVAAGFFMDPSTEAFNYYPVRTDMAHAWVEVWFPGYGWIEYDPTSETMAEGEEFRFSQGTPPELFERLMKEILDNHSRLKEKAGLAAEQGNNSLAALGRNTIRFFARQGPFITLAVLVLFFLTIRSGHLWLSYLRKKPRKKALEIWAHTKRRLALAGFGKSASVGEAEWAKTLDGRVNGLYALYQGSAAARFAPDFSAADSRNMAERYLLFSGEYRKALPRRRRFLAWLLPPLALLIGPSRRRRGAKTAGTILFIILFLSLRSEISRAQDSQPSRADTVYESALAAQKAENWERAIELFNEGSKSYPRDFRFPWSLGNLYYHRRLYRLAWDEYIRAEKILPPDTPDRPQLTGLLYRLANTAGYLN
ncbi:MAG: transglutaminase-like domain-containing protein, partial [Treponema sp.]|nr:transglutaminase-like domain-containing protein [Treponema sp.]